MEKLIENAQITNTMLGYGDRPALIFSVELTGENWRSTFGDRVLDNYDTDKKDRVPDQHAMSVIPKILKVVGVKTWEELKGQYIRVEFDQNHNINAIGNLIKDEWLDLNKFFDT